MKKLFCVLALLLVLPRAGAVSARAAVVIDADTGETLFEQNADSRLPVPSPAPMPAKNVTITVKSRVISVYLLQNFV